MIAAWSPALGTDWTSFSPLIQGWTENPDTVRDSKGRRVFEMERPPRGWVKRPPYGHLTYNGLIMLDYENNPVRDIPGLPLTLASEHQGWLLEGLRRCTRIKVDDFIARYPYKVGYSALLQAMSRWRESKGIRTWAPKNRQSNKIKKPESAVATPDGEGSAILASPITPHTQSGSPTVASSGQEWPPSPEALSQSPYAAYSETGSCNFAVGYSTPSPWDAGSSAKHAVHSSHPMLQQIQPSNPNNGFLTTEYSPWDAEASNRRREGHYPNVPETSYYDQKNTESVVRRVIREQCKQAGSRANIPIAMPQSASFQPLCSIRSEPQESLFAHGDFYSAQPTNIVESNFVQSMLDYSRSHYRTLMSREPPITTFGATYAYQYSELQTHLEQLWPYLGLPPELRAVAPVSGRCF
ncbi:hypothetical protein BDR22DRAFT_547621 [Usnea florida]